MSDKFIKKVIKKVDKYDTIVRHYEKYGKTPVIPHRAFVNYADKLFVEGCVDMAEELLRNASEFVSYDSDALVSLGVIKQMANEHEKAIEYFESAYKKDRRNTKALCLWGNSLTFMNDMEGAVQKYQIAVETDKKAWEAYVFWGIMLMGQHRFKEAKEKLEIAVSYNPLEMRPLFMLASVEIELGFYDAAMEKFMYLKEMSEGGFEGYHNIAYIYFKKKEYEKTIEYAQKAIGRAPFKKESYLLLGDTYILLGKYEEAAGIYQCAEKNKIKSIFMYISWGSIFQIQKKYDEAIEKYLKGLEVCPEDADDELFARLARCYYEIGNYQESRANVINAIRIKAENVMAQEVAADICMREERYEDALKALSVCLRKSKAKAITYHKMAKCYFMLGDFEQSNKYYEKSIEYGRENKRVLAEYVESLVYQGKYEAAYKKLLTLEKMSNDELDILSLVFRVNYNMSNDAYNRSKAIRTAAKIKEKYPDKFEFETQYAELLHN